MLFAKAVTSSSRSCFGCGLGFGLGYRIGIGGGM